MVVLAIRLFQLLRPSAHRWRRISRGGSSPSGSTSWLSHWFSRSRPQLKKLPPRLF